MTRKGKPSLCQAMMLVPGSLMATYPCCYPAKWLIGNEAVCGIHARQSRFRGMKRVQLKENE